MHQTQSLAFPLPLWVIKLIQFAYTFAEEKDDAGDDDAFADDLDDAFADDEDEDEDKDKEDDDGDDDDDDKDKDKDKKSEKKDTSAIHQKKRYREKLNAANARIKELEDKKTDTGSLSEDEKKEKAAEEFLAKKIRDVMKALEAEKSQTEQQREEAFLEELEEVLDENDSVSEKQIREVTEDLGVTPKQALKIILREQKLSKKEKPKIPKEKRASNNVSTDKDKKPEGRQTLDSVNRRIKESLKEGNY